MNQRLIALAAAAAVSCVAAAGASAQETKVSVAISGWTGFAPLTLAKEAGLFKKHGLDVTIRKIPQKDRHLAIASGDIQCAKITIEVSCFFMSCFMSCLWSGGSLSRSQGDPQRW